MAVIRKSFLHLQAIVCQRLNETTEIPIAMIVTTGDVWHFGKLEHTHFVRHPFPFSLENPDMLLGVLDTIFTRCEDQITG